MRAEREQPISFFSFSLSWPRQARSKKKKTFSFFDSPFFNLRDTGKKTLFQPTYRASDGAVDGGLEGRLHLGGETGLWREGRVSERGGRGREGELKFYWLGSALGVPAPQAKKKKKRALKKWALSGASRASLPQFLSRRHSS